MRFTQAVAALASAALVYAENTITFISQDSLDRTVYFTSNPECPDIDPVRVRGHANLTVDIPLAWVGNYYAVVDGKENVPGMLGEFAFNAWGGHTFFDVSAIVNPNDWDGVKKIWPVNDPEPFSGCDLFPCNFVYYLPDDIQTKATQTTDFFCTLGSSGHHPGLHAHSYDDDNDDDNEEGEDDDDGSDDGNFTSFGNQQTCQCRKRRSFARRRADKRPPSSYPRSFVTGKK